MTITLQPDAVAIVDMLAVRFKIPPDQVVDAVLRDWRVATPAERREQMTERQKAKQRWDLADWPAWSDGYRTGWMHFQTRRADCPTRRFGHPRQKAPVNP